MLFVETEIFFLQAFILVTRFYIILLSLQILFVQSISSGTLLWASPL